MLTLRELAKLILCFWFWFSFCFKRFFITWPFCRICPSLTWSSTAHRESERKRTRHCSWRCLGRVRGGVRGKGGRGLGKDKPDMRLCVALSPKRVFKINKMNVQMSQADHKLSQALLATYATHTHTYTNTHSCTGTHTQTHEHIQQYI